jgi:hypothetical protein
MSLSDSPVAAAIGVSDMESAKSFTYSRAGGTQIHVYPSLEDADGKVVAVGPTP